MGAPKLSFFPSKNSMVAGACETMDGRASRAPFLVQNAPCCSQVCNASQLQSPHPLLDLATRRNLPENVENDRRRFVRQTAEQRRTVGVFQQEGRRRAWTRRRWRSARAGSCFFHSIRVNGDAPCCAGRPRGNLMKWPDWFLAAGFVRAAGRVRRTTRQPVSEN